MRNNQTTEGESVHGVRRDFEAQLICQLNTEEKTEILQGGEGRSVREQGTRRRLRTEAGPQSTHENEAGRLRGTRGGKDARGHVMKPRGRATEENLDMILY